MTAYLSAVTDFIAMHPHYAAWAVFLLAFSEAIPIIGTVVPGSTLIVAISALGIEADISPWLLLVAATFGAIVGDGTSFWLGQRCHRQILQRWPLNRFPKLVARSEAFFNRYGGASVFLARFTAVVRAFVPLIAGIVQHAGAPVLCRQYPLRRSSGRRPTSFPAWCSASWSRSRAPAPSTFSSSPSPPCSWAWRWCGWCAIS